MSYELFSASNLKPLTSNLPYIGFPAAKMDRAMMRRMISDVPPPMDPRRESR